MALRLDVDVELLVVTYLAAHTDIDAPVSTALPKTPTFPHLTVFRVGGIAGYPGWLGVAHLQVDAWGTTKAGASLLARTALAALREMPGVHAGGVVTAVEQNLGLTWSPDELSNQSRYVFGVAVHVHPINQ